MGNKGKPIRCQQPIWLENETGAVKGNEAF